MASSASGSDLAIRALLGLVIVGLAVVLYLVTVVPAQRAEARQRETDLTRERMSDVRAALIAYRATHDGYPSSLDSLGLFAASDSAFQAEVAAQTERMRPISTDSLVYSPRSGNRFQYQVAEDSSGVQIYWLGDPDVTADSIGSRDPNPAYRNAASWE